MREKEEKRDRERKNFKKASWHHHPTQVHGIGEDGPGL